MLDQFQIEKFGDPMWRAIEDAGLTTPEELHHVPKTIFARGREIQYDQIAWMTTGEESLTFEFGFDGSADSFDWTPHVLRGIESRQHKSFRISDHLPLWVEFEAP